MKFGTVALVVNGKFHPPFFKLPLNTSNSYIAFSNAL